MSCISCDRRPSSATQTVRLPVKLIAVIKPVTQLPPNRTVHVAVDPPNNVYYTIETTEGQDGVVVAGDNGIPRATQLTTGNILAAMGETVGGTGNIQDLVAGPDGILWFYFEGGKGRRVRACIGQYTPRTESISIIFDTQALRDLSGMGASLELARGELIPSGQRMFLLLRHSDAWSIFRFENQRRRLGAQFSLTVPYTKVWADDESLNLTDPRYELSPGIGENLLLVDRQSGTMWQVDDAGRATVRMLLTGLPSELSRPLVIKDDHLILFASDSEPLEAETGIIPNRRLPQTTYPALLEIEGEKITSIGRDDLRVSGEIPAYALRIKELIPAPDETWVAYDLASGQLLRIKRVEAD
ncbi:MAG TPA: hypothetical protein VH518_00970 [Tepidisphaeraceae bacterium]